jgi:hypothetical protein
LQGYYLSSFTPILGTPERPLSDLGYKGYLSYWSAVILRTLAILFYDRQPDIFNVLLPASHSIISPSKHKLVTQSATNSLALAEARLKRETLRLRRILLGQPLRRSEIPDSKRSEDGHREESKSKNGNRRSLKGWDGEVPRSLSESNNLEGKEEHKEQQQHQQSSSILPIAAKEEEEEEEVRQYVLDSDTTVEQLNTPLSIETTLDRLSLATNIRYDDLCFAMTEMGLLRWAKDVHNSNGQQGGLQPVSSERKRKVEAGDISMVVIFHDMVRQAIKHNRIKRPVLDVNYVLMPEISTASVPPVAASHVADTVSTPLATNQHYSHPMTPTT